MTVTLTDDTANARVAIDVDGIGTEADTVTIERSTDQVRWTTVRGATALPVDAGALADTHYDYEFVPDVVNYYRVRSFDSDPIEFVAAGASVTGVNSSVVPPLPAGVEPGDLLVILASIRNSGTGTVDVPEGWEAIRYLSGGGEPQCAVLLGRRYVAGDMAPTVTFSGGVAGADTIAQCAAWRRADIEPAAAASQLNVAMNEINFPDLTVPMDGMLILLAAWKQDDFSSAAFPGVGVWSDLHEHVSTAGDDAGQTWAYQIQTTKVDIDAGTIGITPDTATISRVGLVALPRAEFLNEQTGSLTPTLTSVWLKSPQRPFLNQAISLGGPPLETDRRARGDVHEVLDAALPMATSQPAGSPSFDLLIRTTTDQDAQTLEYAIASGDVLCLHAPAGKVVPSGATYVRVERAGKRLLHVAGTRRHWSVPVRQVAPPGPDVAYALLTWQTILDAYGTWDALLAANATWDDVLSLLAAPSEVVA